MERYHCDPGHQGQSNPNNKCLTLEDCIEVKDLKYLVYQYTPEVAADELPLDEQMNVLRRLTGVTLSNPNDISNVLRALGTGRVGILLNYLELREYIIRLGWLEDEYLLKDGSLDSLNYIRIRMVSSAEKRKELITLMVKLRATKAMTFFNSVEYRDCIMDVLEAEIKAGTLSVGELDDWILSNPNIGWAALFIYIVKGKLDFLLRFYRVAKDDPSIPKIANIVISYGRLSLVKDFLTATGTMPSLNVLLVQSGF